MQVMTPFGEVETDLVDIPRLSTALSLSETDTRQLLKAIEANTLLATIKTQRQKETDYVGHFPY
jgi:hypothetical protein